MNLSLQAFEKSLSAFCPPADPSTLGTKEIWRAPAKRLYPQVGMDTRLGENRHINGKSISSIQKCPAAASTEK